MTFLKAWSKLKRTFLLGASLALLLVSSSKLVYGQYYLTMPQDGVPPHVVQNSVGYSHVEKGETEPQPDVDQTSSQLTKPTASEIWSAFLLGSPKAKKVSKPKFAFSRNENVSNSSRTFPLLRQSPFEKTPQIADNKQPNSYLPQQITNDRITGYNRTTPPEYNTAQQNNTIPRQIGETIVQGKQVSDQVKSLSDIQQKIKELDKYLAENQPSITYMQSPRLEYDASIDGPQRANSSKIRQTSAETPIRSNGGIRTSLYEEKVSSLNGNRIETMQYIQSAQKNDQSTKKAREMFKQSQNMSIPEVLPVRPNALQISERSFVSTEIVRLPKPGNLASPSPIPIRQLTNMPSTLGTGLTETENEPTFVQPQITPRVTNSSSNEDEAIVQPNTSNVLRPRGSFINPRDL
ncbi:MAG: hypothetical protein PHO46_03960 [Thermoguttaceae bacterium]|nr:hypothetical protein [Thermoguttaceae bacterium]